MSVTIKDPEGNKPRFAQWECDRLLVISGTEDMPICRFAHPLLTHALVVNGEASGNDWTVKVPNFLLQFEGRFAVSVVAENSNDEVREIAAAVFVILPRQKPQDYEYTDNIGYVNWVLLSEQAQDLIDEIQAKLDNGELKGEKGDAFTYEDFTEEQLESLTGPTGPQGEPGDDGTNGTDGVSPTVSVTNITGGHRVTITDATHPSGQSFDVMDGEDGGGSAEEVFWATYGTTTSAEIEAAYQAGKIVLCEYNNSVYRLVIRSSATGHAFDYAHADHIYTVECSGNTWTNTSRALAPQASPIFSGTPTAPTAASGTNTTQLATTAFVQQEIGALDASDVGAIAAPSSPETGAFLVWSGSAWTAQTLSTWQGGNF